MPAPTKSWNTIADGEVDAGSPLDQTLLTKIRDDLYHLQESLYGTYTAAIAHNHDGVNSATIDIGPNLIRNPGFEDSLNGWTDNAYSGGSIAINTAQEMEGANCVAITSTVIANGGGYVQCALLKIGGDQPYRFSVQLKASVANVSFSAVVIWYDGAFSQISSSSIASSANTPTSQTIYRKVICAPTTARYCLVRLIGGDPGIGSSAGTIYFDYTFCGLGYDRWLTAGDYLQHANDGENFTGNTSYTKTHELITGFAGPLRIKFDLKSSNGADQVSGRIYLNGIAVGTERTTTSGTYVTYSEDILVSSGDLIQVYCKQTSGTALAYVTNLRIYSAEPATFTTISP